MDSAPSQYSMQPDSLELKRGSPCWVDRESQWETKGGRARIHGRELDGIIGRVDEWLDESMIDDYFDGVVHRKVIRIVGKQLDRAASDVMRADE